MCLTGCATGYQAYTWTGGYKDEALGDGHYKVEYRGNGTLSAETVLDRWHRRSSELCPNGYDEVKRDSEDKTKGIGIIQANQTAVIGEIMCKR